MKQFLIIAVVFGLAACIANTTWAQHHHGHCHGGSGSSVVIGFGNYGGYGGYGYNYGYAPAYRPVYGNYYYGYPRYNYYAPTVPYYRPYGCGGGGYGGGIYFRW